MANTISDPYGQSQPSTAFLLKCAKEKEKLRSKFRKDLQEQMSFVLEEGLYSDLLLGLNSNSTNANTSRLVPAHQGVLQVRTPAFLDFVKRNENSQGLISYDTNLEEVELQQFLKKAYTDDDIRRHECEVIRLSKTYAELFHDGKTLLNKHIFDNDDCEVESLNSENFVTPKSSPITPDKLIHFSEMFRSNPTKCKGTISEGPLKLNTNAHKHLIPKSDSLQEDLKLGPLSSPKDFSEEYDCDIDNESEFFPSYKIPKSSVLYNCTDISSTSIEIDESDFMVEDLCSSLTGEITKPSTSENDDSNMQIDSEESPTSGMVRSGTFDLHTQAPLEDYIENNQIIDVSCVNNNIDSSNNVLSSSVPSRFPDDSISFFLHEPSQKPNLFKCAAAGESFNSDIDTNDNNLSNSYHFPKLDGSITDSGFMSHSTFSMLSDNGIPNSFSSSLVMSSDTNYSSDNVWKLSEEAMNSSLERSSKLSGSMFPFYIDINNLPEKTASSQNAGHGSMATPKNLSEFFEQTDRQAQIRQKSQYSKLNGGRGRFQDRLTKAQSTPHLDVIKDSSGSSRRVRPRSCYMYIDLDTVQLDKPQSPKSMKRAPSSISMYVDLNEDKTTESNNKLNDSNFIDTSYKDSKSSVKAFGSAFDIGKSDTMENQKRKLSDSFLQAREPNSVLAGYCSLRRPGENMSDSALNHIISGNSAVVSSKVPINNAYALQKSKSMTKSSEVSDTYLFKGKTSSKWISPDTLLDSEDSSRGLQVDDSDGFSDGRTLSSLLNDIIRSDKRGNHLGQDINKKNEFANEVGLLPMSPILRRKCQNKEVRKISPPPIHVKASTKPQDIYAMTFPRPDNEDTLKGTYKVSDEPFAKSQQSEPSSKKKPEQEIITKVHQDVMDSESCMEKSVLDSVSRSESSAFSMSAETSSSGKLIVIEPHKEESKSACSFSLPYEFDDDVETVYSEVSDLSSSLGGRSGFGSIERRWRESSGKEPGMSALHNIYRMLEACSKLGEDLLRMFLEEIHADCVVEAEGKTIKAHRCILSSRCKYFATILREPGFSDTGIINLQGFSYASVHFALCHIYSGALNLPKDPNIMELSLLADVLHLDSLVDVLILHLKTHYCHFFHKPCPQCVHGVLECLPLCVSCGFFDLRDKCIRWLGRYFTRTWPNKVFASLPDDLTELCFQCTVKNLSIETVIEMSLSCDGLITTMPHLKWSEPVFGLVTRLLQECIHFMADNFNRILCSEGFLVLGKGHSWNVSALEDDIISAVELMTPDIACKSSVKLSQILSLIESSGYSEYEFTQNFVDLLHKVNRHCERYLIHNANKVVHCQSWPYLAAEVQKKIKDAAVIVFEFEKPTAKPPRLSSLQKKQKKQKNDEQADFFENSTYPKFNKNGKFRDISDSSEKRIDHDISSKKLVSPITEESHCNGLSSMKDLHDIHDEDSLKEMQELPHDLSVSQNNYHDVSQQSSSGGILESEETHSGTHCSDNPDSLDANEEIMSDSKDDIDCSLFAADDISHDDKHFLLKSYDNTSSNSNLSSNQNQNISCDIDQNSNEKFYPKSDFSPTDDNKLKSHTDETKIPRNVCDAPHVVRCHQKSPVKSLLPLPKPLNLADKEGSDVPCKDLVAEIDADSRMVTHCLQEAEMLEQQLSRKLLHQQQAVSTPTKVFNCPGQPVIDSRRSSRTMIGRVQKSLSSSQVKSVGSPARGKSPGKLTPSPSSPHVPRLLKSAAAAENNCNKDTRAAKKSQSPKMNVLPGQRSFRVVEGINVTRQISPTKRLSTRSTKSKASNFSAQEGRNHK